jgi:serine/threonine-protein kinase
MNVDRDPRRALAEAEAARTAMPNDATTLSVLAGVYSAIGRFEDAVTSVRAAERLDPRAMLPLQQLRGALSALRRYREAHEVADREMALPPNLSSIEDRVIVSLAEGDLVGARRFLDSVSRRVSEDELVTYLAIYQDLGWVLDDALQRRLLALDAAHFDNDRAIWAIVRAQVYGWRGDSVMARAWGDTAARGFDAQMRLSPEDAQRHAFYGLSLAYAGHYPEAIAEGERGVALLPVERDAVNGPYQVHLLARIYLLAGERVKALDLLEQLLGRPYYVSPEWLRIDPTFASLRGNPRFESLAARPLTVSCKLTLHRTRVARQYSLGSENRGVNRDDAQAIPDARHDRVAHRGGGGGVPNADRFRPAGRRPHATRGQPSSGPAPRPGRQVCRGQSDLPEADRQRT